MSFFLNINMTIITFNVHKIWPVYLSERKTLDIYVPRFVIAQSTFIYTFFFMFSRCALAHRRKTFSDNVRNIAEICFIRSSC